MYFQFGKEKQMCTNSYSSLVSSSCPPLCYRLWQQQVFFLTVYLNYSYRHPNYHSRIQATFQFSDEHGEPSGWPLSPASLPGSNPEEGRGSQLELQHFLQGFGGAPEHPTHNPLQTTKARWSSCKCLNSHKRIEILSLLPIFLEIPA